MSSSVGSALTERVRTERERYVARGVSTSPLVVARAEGARVWDAEGREYLDFAGGIGCQNLGHGLPAVVEAIHEQVDRFLHQCFMVGMYEPYVEVCRRLAELSPCRGDEQKSLLVNSGAEAVENAVKIARAATGRPAVVVFDRAFHGRTTLTLAMTSKVVPYKLGFGPLAPEVYRVPAPYPLRGVSVEDALAGLGAALQAGRRPGERRLRRGRAGAGRGRLPRHAAGVPARAQGALRPARDPLRRRRGAERRRADGPGLGDRARGRRAGSARLGQVARRRPAARGGHRARRRRWTPSRRAGSAGRSAATRSPALRRPSSSTRSRASASASAPTRSARRSARGSTASPRRTLPSPRRAGSGRWLALELVEPTPTLANAVTAAARERGLLLLSCGLYGNVIRILAPLVASDDELARGLGILEEALEHASCQRALSRRASRRRKRRRTSRLVGVRKSYGHVVAVDGIDLDVAAGRVLHPARPVRLRKDDDAAPDRRLRAARRRADRARRRRRRQARPVRARRQHRLPGLRPLPAHGRGGERRLRPPREGRTAQGAARAGGAGARGRPPPWPRRAQAPRSSPGGQRQRVALARALVNSPRVLLLDEPLGALDLKLRQEMQIELKRIQREVSAEGMTFVYVTHDQEEALTMSDRLAVFNEGRIEQVGPPREVYERPATEFVAGFVGVSNVLEREGRRFTIRPEKIRLLDAEGATADRRRRRGRPRPGRRVRRDGHPLHRRARTRRHAHRRPAERRLAVPATGSHPVAQVRLAWQPEQAYEITPKEEREHDTHP